MIPISHTNLKARRLRALMTQEDLAAASGVNRVTIARLEAHQSRTYVSTLKKLATALGCAALDLTAFPETDR
jgi:transcriptional regulator with XRE-family HTH domain